MSEPQNKDKLPNYLSPYTVIERTGVVQQVYLCAVYGPVQGESDARSKAISDAF